MKQKTNEEILAKIEIDKIYAKSTAKEIASKLDGWQLEGGAHNIARRDGIGSLILDAWNEIVICGNPDHQAIDLRSIDVSIDRDELIGEVKKNILLEFESQILKAS